VVAWLGGVSMKEPRALFVLSSFSSVCVGEIIKIRQKSVERENARACGDDSSRSRRVPFQ
jgi:hypothetical protein